jgi:GNAT superfamily N-acetyltransferase
MVEYTDSLENVRADDLSGFFVGWPAPPTADEHLRLLRGSAHVVLARDGTRVVGFVTAISDGVLSACIPLLEVVPGYQGQGIGTELMRRLLAELESLYMVDLSCDAELEPFYTRFGFQVLPRGMGLRR